MAQSQTTEDRFYRGGQRQVMVLSLDEAANDSDKTFTVPTGKVWEVRCIWSEWVLDTSTNGTRTPVMRYLDASSDVVYQSSGDTVAGDTTQVVSATRVWYNGADTAKAGEESIPLVVLPAGWGIQILDSAAIAATVDDLNVQIMVEQYDVIA